MADLHWRSGHRDLATYLVPTFALGFVWHLILFKDYYGRLAMYRQDVIIPFGFLSMSIQAVLFALIYERVSQRAVAVRWRAA